MVGWWHACLSLGPVGRRLMVDPGWKSEHARPLGIDSQIFPSLPFRDLTNYLRYPYDVLPSGPLDMSSTN